MNLIIQCYDKLVAAVFKDRLREIVGGHFPTDGGDAGVAVFSTDQHLGHNSEGGVAQIGSGIAQLLYGHAAVQTAGAVNFQTVRDKVDLHRCALGQMAVIPVNQGVQDGLADGFNGILRPISAFAGFRVDNGLDFHAALTESDGFVRHGLDGTLNAFLVQKTRIHAVMFTDLGAWNYQSSDGQLGQVTLRVNAEIHDSSRGGGTAAGHIQYLQRLVFGELSETGVSSQVK